MSESRPRFDEHRLSNVFWSGQLSKRSIGPGIGPTGCQSWDISIVWIHQVSDQLQLRRYKCVNGLSIFNLSGFFLLSVICNFWFSRCCGQVILVICFPSGMTIIAKYQSVIYLEVQQISSYHSMAMSMSCHLLTSPQMQTMELTLSKSHSSNHVSSSLVTHALHSTNPNTPMCVRFT